MMPYHNGRYIIDNSGLECLATCTTQFVMQVVLGLRSADGKAARDAGKVSHKLFARHMLGHDPEDNLKLWDSEYAVVDALLPDARLSHDNVRTILSEWLKAHTPDNLPYIPDPKTVERGITVPLTDEIDFFALRDLAVVVKATGEYIPLDWKTTGKINAWWSKKWRLSSQMDGYVWATREHSGAMCESAWIGVVEFSKLPEPVKRKCRTHGLPQEECRHLHANWDLLTTSRTPEMLEEWKRTAVMLARQAMKWESLVTMPEMIGMVRMQGKFNGGCTFCEYAEWCRNGRQPGMVGGMFTLERWEPWKEVA